MRIYKLLSRIREFGKKNEGIQAIFLCGGDMEDKRDTFYIITKGRYNPKLQNKLTQLEIDVMREFDYNLHSLEWPSGIEKISQFEIDKGIRIYEKQKHSKV